MQEVFTRSHLFGYAEPKIDAEHFTGGNFDSFINHSILCVTDLAFDDHIFVGWDQTALGNHVFSLPERSTTVRHNFGREKCPHIHGEEFINVPLRRNGRQELSSMVRVNCR